MENNEKLNQNLLEIKIKVMTQRIEKLKGMYQILFSDSEMKKQKSLEVIKNQYISICNVIIRRKEYEKYKEIENIIVKGIAKIEFDLDKKIYSTVKYYWNIVINIIQEIKGSKNYKNFCHIEKEIEKIENLKELVKLYTPYINESEIKRTQDMITRLKFELLLRKQVEQLIYEEIKKENFLLKYDNIEEKETFKGLLSEEMNRIRPKNGNKSEIINDELFGKTIEEILNSTKLIEKMIIIDIVEDPFKYTNLLEAKVFNAHSCNIANNPFEVQEYMSTYELSRKGYSIDIIDPKGLETNRINFSLLRAVLKNIITHENVNIMECNDLYNRFGFECNPIFYSDGQRIIKMIYDYVRWSDECKEIAMRNKKTITFAESLYWTGTYIKVEFEGFKYKFSETTRSRKDILEELFFKRREEVNPTTETYIQGKRKMREYEIWERYSLEEMCSQRIGGVSYVSIPCKEATNDVDYGINDFKLDMKPLWEKYEEDCKYLKIDVRASKFDVTHSHFYIYINMGDITDLPIDFEKVKKLDLKYLSDINMEINEGEGR